MSTNFYICTSKMYEVTCYACGHMTMQPERIHLGKRSNGWPFLFKANIDWTPDNAYEKWCELLRQGTIIDEYGREYSYEEMIDIVNKYCPYACAHTRHNQKLDSDQFCDNQHRLWSRYEFS